MPSMICGARATICLRVGVWREQQLPVAQGSWTKCPNFNVKPLRKCNGSIDCAHLSMTLESRTGSDDRIRVPVSTWKMFEIRPKSTGIDAEYVSAVEPGIA